ncbi:DUF1460 domain-containing protein [Acinetobacter rudis]|uniref:DUF1460 domain-containing protein n=1 Tax=Acinetobacter rudis TaxID=632955 RepID=A0AAW8J7P8_9GAMM|nr:DUF1460 domain-containing protein [Acinetobacter rudis]MDQ8935201.1 DUF1460 domain-containing protein [Acinetobacter rudis]MDQ9017069.1 DUF1460 domain-containing protein [Acinetobacter rudis]
MKKRPIIAIITCLLAGCPSDKNTHYSTLTSEHSKEKINKIIEHEVKPNTHLNSGDLIDRVSAPFLGTPYLANTLVGGPDQQEILVINLDAVDCFTYLDYVVALTKSHDESSFEHALINVRYKNSDVTYYNRKHFFTDWYASSPQNAVDITSTLSSDAITVEKVLNQKEDGSEYIKGLGAIPRTITYIPGQAIHQQLLDNLRNGDLIGIYSPISGLDVSHTGIVIKKNRQVFYRNASSLAKNNQVVDTPFLEYMNSKPGIVVLRVMN